MVIIKNSKKHGKKLILFDKDDEHFFTGYVNIIKNSKTKHFYVMVRPKGPGNNKRVHRLIMNAPIGMDVDHIDGNGLNNQRSNLRICTRSQNLHNTSIQSRNTSGFKGVQLNKGSWMARIKVNGKSIYIGTWKSKTKAIQMYNKKSRELLGEFHRETFTYKERQRKLKLQGYATR